MSLLQWTRKTLLNAVTDAFFSVRHLLGPELKLLQHFVVLDDESWKLNYQYPHYMPRNMYHAKDELLAVINTCLGLPTDQRDGGGMVDSKTRGYERPRSNLHINADESEDVFIILLLPIL